MGAARYIWIDDSLKPASEGVVPFVSAAVQYGFSVFEGIRCYQTENGPAIFRLAAERLGVLVAEHRALHLEPAGGRLAALA